MAVPEPTTVAEEWLYATLAADAAVAAAVGDRYWPEYAPVGAAAPFLTFSLVGGEAMAPVAGAPPCLWTLLWEVTAWGEGPGRQQLRGPMQAALAAVAGDGLAGRPAAPFGSGDGSRWVVRCAYEGPVATPPLAGEVAGEGVWARIAHAVMIELSPA